MQFNLCMAECTGNSKNCLYPFPITVTDADVLRAAATMDHVCGMYKNNYRSLDNFLWSDVAVMDCDNDHSENPADWMTPETMAAHLPDVSFAAVPSRNNNKEKGGKSARPRFHLYFPIPTCSDKELYAQIKQSIYGAFPFLDSNALDAARFLFGSEADEVFWHEGWMSIVDVIDTGEVLYDGFAQPAQTAERVIPEGARNCTLSRYAGRVLKRFGISDKAKELFLKEADRCDPPMDPEELKTIWGSAVKFMKKVQSEPGYIPPDQYDGFDAQRSLKPEDYSDIGQAKVLAREYGNELKYTDATDFLRFTGEYWYESKQMAVGAAEEFLDLQLADAESQVEIAMQALVDMGLTREDIMTGGKSFVTNLTDEGRKAYHRLSAAIAYKGFVMRRRDMKYISSALSAIKPMVLMNVQDFDKDGFLLNTPGQTYDLRSGGKRGYAPQASDYITKQTLVAPGTEGKELWDKALDTFFCGDRQLIEYVQLIAGLAAIGKVYEEHLVIAYGEGRNGKSTFWNSIMRVLGSYSGTFSADALTVGCRRNVKPEMAELKGRRLIIASELEEGMRLNNSIVKQLCSTDEIQAEKKFKDPFHFTPSHTIVLYTNHLPKVGGNDDGIWRRLIVIPFNAKIEGTSDVKNYADYLVENAGGYILRWIMEGAQKAIERNFKIPMPKIVRDAVEAYRNDNDWLAHFLEECCEVSPEYSCKSGELYQEYRAYCTRTGEYTRSTTDFYAALDKTGHERKKFNDGARVRGLRLKNADFLD
ncbi:MAG: primase C-terminal domain-containing protein [Clostridia bacterium]|nr:primase C-terminal domain-containing protein [Clostridia bacterium]